MRAREATRRATNQGTAMILQIKVKPNSRMSALEPLNDGTWLARIQSPPVDGKANEELIRLIAQRFKVPKTQVSIRSGVSGRLKRVRIEGCSGPGSP